MLKPLLVAVLTAAADPVPPVGTPLLTLEPIEAPPPPVGTPLLVLAPIEPAATDAPRAAPAPAASVSAPSEEPRRPWFGAQVDAGLPEGFGGSLVFRPWYFVRAHLGGVTNTAAGGIRGGLSLIPFRWYLTPALTGEIGHLFEGDLNGTVASVLQNAHVPDGMLDKVSYTFYSAQLGLEIGAPDRFVFYVRGGVSRVAAVLRGPPRQNGSTTVDAGEVHLDMTIPSAKLGLLLYF